VVEWASIVDLISRPMMLYLREWTFQVEAETNLQVRLPQRFWVFLRNIVN
jgi:hypothetical protein